MSSPISIQMITWIGAISIWSGRCTVILTEVAHRATTRFPWVFNTECMVYLLMGPWTCTCSYLLFFSTLPSLLSTVFWVDFFPLPFPLVLPLSPSSSYARLSLPVSTRGCCNWAASRKKVSNGLSCFHTKRRMSVRWHACPPFFRYDNDSGH